MHIKYQPYNLYIVSDTRNGYMYVFSSILFRNILLFLNKIEITNIITTLRDSIHAYMYTHTYAYTMYLCVIVFISLYFYNVFGTV
jgi:hypothetical protein